MTGNELKNLRHGMGLTQQQAATLCGRTQGWVAQLEARKHLKLSDAQTSILWPLVARVPTYLQVPQKSCQRCGKLMPGVHGNRKFCYPCATEHSGPLCSSCGLRLPTKLGRPFSLCEVCSELGSEEDVIGGLETFF
jgi:hypothetical protein